MTLAPFGKKFNEVGMKNKENDKTINSKIKLKENVITSESKVAEVFNNYFTNKASKSKEPIINSDFKLLNSLIGSKVPSNTDFQTPFTNQTFVRILF